MNIYVGKCDKCGHESTISRFFGKKNVKELNELCRQCKLGVIVYAPLQMEKKSKYKNKKIRQDGHKFDSDKEYRRYVQLRLLERTGKIKNLKCQVPYLLQEGFDLKGKHYRPIKYIVDFKYDDIKRNKVILEDVKGFKTEVYKIKKKLLLYNIVSCQQDVLEFLET